MTKAKELSTRDRLKLSARRLFAERGVSGVTVREILANAGDKNGASLNYYFTSKEVLVREIIIDIFSMLEERWYRRLTALEAKDSAPDLRDYVRLLVACADTSDVEEVPTAARLAEIFSQNYYTDVAAALKENKLHCYDSILARMARLLTDLPDHVVRQRLVFVTRYLSSIFALYEGARLRGSDRQRAALGTDDYNLGDVIDTAVGLLTAEVHNADAGLHLYPFGMATGKGPGDSAGGNKGDASGQAAKRPDTKEKLLTAARALFAENGIEGVTVREILAAAGEKNGASLNYHFGKKEELVKRIAVDIFGFLDRVWADELQKLDAREEPASVRDLVAVIVNASVQIAEVLDRGHEQTSLRLIDRLSQERQHLLSTIIVENNYRSYPAIMQRIAALQPHVPPVTMQHRAIFLTRYLSTIMAMYEEAQLPEATARRRLVGSIHDIGNVIDTAIGIVSAPIVDGERT